MKVLAIGNSFSVDATRYLHQIAKADDFEMKVVGLAIGGCSLRKHYINALEDNKTYGMSFNGIGTGFFASIKDALISDEWDVVTIQQVSYKSVDYNTFQPYLQFIVEYIRKYSPESQIYLHQCWPYKDGSPRLCEQMKYASAGEMLSDVKKSYELAAEAVHADGIILSGEVMYELVLRSMKNIYRDNLHASLGLGRYTLGLTWYATLTGRDIMCNRFSDFDEEISEEEMIIAKECVRKIMKKNVLDLVCKRTMDMTGAEGCYWDWGMGVADFGLIKVYRQTKDKRILDYLKKFVDDNLNGDEIPKTVNTVLPYMVALFLYEETGEEFYAERCREIAEWLMDGAARTRNGGLAHSGPNDDWAKNKVLGVRTTIEDQNKQLKNWADQLWVDTLYMAVIFLAEAGMKLNNRKYIEEAWKQIKIHAECIQAENGLFYHGYSDSLKNNRSAVLWGRGNGWVAACIPEICELTGESDPEVVKIFQKHMEALVRVQDENGLWHTVLDEPASYCETSASAGIVYGMMKGIRLGLLPEFYIEPAKRGYEAVLAKIAEDGKVTDVSQGTGIRETKESYMGVPTIKIMSWGQGLALLMLAEPRLW